MEPDHEELLRQEIAEGRWGVVSGTPLLAGIEPLTWPNLDKDQIKAIVRKMIGRNLAYRAGAIATAKREGRDLH